MRISVLDMFSIGIGPSSSHTVGPMRAARRFAERLLSLQPAGGASDNRKVGAVGDRPGRIAELGVGLYGALGATGKGHATDRAIILGLMGHAPDTIDVDAVDGYLAALDDSGTLMLGGQHPVSFAPDRHIRMLPRERLPHHVNGMHFAAFDAAGTVLLQRRYYSIGGGFVVTEDEMQSDALQTPDIVVPYAFTSAEALIRHAETTGLSISDIMLANEAARRPEAETRAALSHIWTVMQASIERGCRAAGPMPGLNVERRAKKLHSQLLSSAEVALSDPLTVMDWVNLYALAVNEENATGGRVVTAPTNGAAGIVPAVLMYYMRFHRGASEDCAVRFLLTAGAVGTLFKENASISGAEVGCQGEVGSACSMAAAGLTEVLGGTPAQVENAAEIAMEHNLGLTCDPVGGLVQVPCIERNAMAAVKAINAARLALKGDGKHFVSLDKVIRTMRITGRDMKTQYKETARGGLAVTVPIDQSVVSC